MGSKVGTGSKPPSSGSGNARSDAAKPVEGGSSSGSGGSPPGGNRNPFGGKGSGGGRKKPQQNEMTVAGMSAIGALGATAILYMLTKNAGFEKYIDIDFSFFSGSNFVLRKISWHEFENVILPSGTVEKIEVINRSVAR